LTTERRERVRRLFADALKFPASERRAFVVRSCGSDADLLAQVELLLAEPDSVRTLTRVAPAEGRIPDGDQPLLDTHLKERYRLRSVIGRGGFSIVYLATDEQLHSKQVVVKVLLHAAPGPWLRKKFHGEIAALARLNHHNVVSVSDWGETADGRPFLVMEHVEGAPLRTLMKPEGMDFEVVADVLRQASRGLDAAHRNGIWHRDLKPENIMVQALEEGERRIKLIDFGLATVSGSEAAADPTTRTAGTPGYMAPEQVNGKPSASSDIYALGVIAYEMVTGRLPFRAPAAVALYALQMAEVKIRPKALNPELPEEAERAILKALRFDQDGRQRTVSEFIQELVPALQKPKAPALFSRGDREPHYGRLAPKMCNRRPQEDEFRRFVARSRQEHPGRPVLCLIHGDEGECHESLVERLAYQADLPDREKREEESSPVRIVKVPWQFDGTVEVRIARLLAWLFERLGGGRGSRLDDTSPAALSGLLASSLSSFVVLQHDIRTARWDDAATPFIQAYFDYLGRMPDSAAGSGLIVFLNIVYPHSPFSERRRFLPDMAALAHRLTKARVRRDLARIADLLRSSPHHEMCPCLLLDELKPVNRDDVLEWFSLHNILETEEQRLRAAGRIFAGAGAGAGSKSMAEIETHLRAVQQTYFLERGAT
jgi:serine/threonine protein kinase